MSLFLFLVLFCPLMAQEQITFYSQTNSIINKNQEYLKKQVGATREIIFLNGKYEVLEAKNENYVGNVSLPAVFHQQSSFIFRKSFPRLNDSSAKYYLKIERLTGKITVYLNDQLIFNSKHNYLPQTIPLNSDLITKNENKLEIHLDSWDRLKDKEPRWFPILLPKVNNGISGSIYLEKRASLHISTVTINRDSALIKSDIQGEVTILSDTVITDNYQLEIEYNGSSGNSKRSQLEVFPDSLHKTLTIPFKFTPDSLELWSVTRRRKNRTNHQKDS